MAMQVTGMSFSTIVLLSELRLLCLDHGDKWPIGEYSGQTSVNGDKGFGVLIWTEFVNKYFHRGNYICDIDCHFWSGFICSFDWEHAGLAAGSIAVAASLGDLFSLPVVKDGGKLFFRGQLIWEAVVDELMLAGMANAKQFRIRNSRFADVLDSLPGSSLKDISGNYTMRSFYHEVVKLLNSNRVLHKV
ncbi:hypothetical protein Syun_009474 [Stephania yunnanensis]|uniref:Uncharacterized protein n=1 Tax=Stephania yunnanensis TaxID=152371 RepID=A0AAP0PQW6_9MAGN